MFDECIGCKLTRYDDEPPSDRKLALCPTCRLTRYYKLSRNHKIFEKFSKGTKLYVLHQVLSTHKKHRDFERILLKDSYMSQFVNRIFIYEQEVKKLNDEKQIIVIEEDADKVRNQGNRIGRIHESSPDEEDSDDEIDENGNEGDDEVSDGNSDTNSSSSSEEEEQHTKSEAPTKKKQRLSKLEARKSNRCGGCKKNRSEDEPAACKLYLNCPKCVIKRRMGNRSKNYLDPSVKLYALKQVDESQQSYQMLAFKDKMIKHDEFLSQFANKKFDYAEEMRKLGHNVNE